MFKNLSSDLVERFRKGDEAALAELMQLLTPRLIGYVRSKRLSREDAEEVVLEAFMKLWRRQHFTGPRHLVGCAYETCNNLVKDHFRKKGLRIPESTGVNWETVPNPESDAGTAEVDTRELSIDDELKKLVERYDREILLRSYREKSRSVVEEAISLRTELVEAKEFHGGTVRSRRMRALERYEAFLRNLPEPEVDLPPAIGRQLVDWEEAAGGNRPPARLLLFHLPPKQQRLFAALLLRLSVVASVPEIQLRETLVAVLRLAEQTKSKQMRRDVQAFIQSGGFPDVELYAGLIPVVEPSGGSAAPGLSPTP